MSTGGQKWSKNTGVFILILAIFQVIPVLYAIVVGESANLIYAHLIGFFVTLAVGVLLLLLGKKALMSAGRPMGFLTAVSIMVLSALLGAVPYVLGLDITVVDAIFESTSGFSTTGLSVLEKVSDVPGSLLLWRAMTQGIGAIFALIYFVRVIYRMEDQYWQGETAFWNKLKLPKHIPNVYKSVLAVIMIFFILLFLQSVILMLSGVPIFYAFTQSISTVSTGGFYFTDGPLFNYQGSDPQWVKYVTLLFMWISGLSYVSHTRTLLGDHKVNSTLIVYIKATLFGSLLLFLLNPIRMEVGFFEHVFRATSLISSSGYELKSVDLALFTDSMILVAIVMALIGGTMGSPAGGMKLNRVSVAIRMLRMELKKAVVPNQAVLSINYNGKLIDKDFMMRTMAMIFIWVITAVSGVMILSFTADMTLTEASVMGIGALGNLGMTTMSVAELASMETAGKLVLIMLMMVGRVEIVPFIILLKSRLQVKTGGTL